MIVSPGVATTIPWNGINQSEENIIRKFGFVWRISFAKRENYKKASYTYAFAAPTDDLSRNFHLSREVLIVIPEAKVFLPRVLDFIDRTLLLFQNRLDKLCVILVSTDTEIKSKIADIVKQDK